MRLEKGEDGKFRVLQPKDQALNGRSLSHDTIVCCHATSRNWLQQSSIFMVFFHQTISVSTNILMTVLSGAWDLRCVWAWCYQVHTNVSNLTSSSCCCCCCCCCCCFYVCLFHSIWVGIMYNNTSMVAPGKILLVHPTLPHFTLVLKVWFLHIQRHCKAPRPPYSWSWQVSTHQTKLWSCPCTRHVCGWVGIIVLSWNQGGLGREEKGEGMREEKGEGMREGKDGHTGYCGKPVSVAKQHTMHVTHTVSQFEVTTTRLISPTLCTYHPPSPLPPTCTHNCARRKTQLLTFHMHNSMYIHHPPPSTRFASFPASSLAPAKNKNRSRGKGRA